MIRGLSIIGATIILLVIAVRVYDNYAIRAFENHPIQVFR